MVELTDPRVAVLWMKMSTDIFPRVTLGHCLDCLEYNEQGDSARPEYSAFCPSQSQKAKLKVALREAGVEPETMESYFKAHNGDWRHFHFDGEGGVGCCISFKDFLEAVCTLL